MPPLPTGVKFPKPDKESLEKKRLWEEGRITKDEYRVYVLGCLTKHRAQLRVLKQKREEKEAEMRKKAGKETVADVREKEWEKGFRSGWRQAFRIGRGVENAEEFEAMMEKVHVEELLEELLKDAADAGRDAAGGQQQ
ncbi:hypothetical protein B9Z65_7693 [Elsinoe australis]|uniref:Uncharacterized protein n=1 Tax=Elsinoe australis TaxID=40998 RepID=A0A2P8A099_9PEZI|nr:hypothetical protein B9Z65_7693 [Elsinoe australis]